MAWVRVHDKGIVRGISQVRNMNGIRGMRMEIGEDRDVYRI